MKSDFKYSEEYKTLNNDEKKVVDSIAEIVFFAQYAEVGSKTEARRKASFAIYKAIVEATDRYFKEKYSK